MTLGPEPTIPGPLVHPTPPSFRPPPGSCDSHCHVFGPAATFPFAPDRTFTPPDVPEAALARLHRTLGIDRAVIVQSASHGRDQAVLIDALRTGGGRYRGVALIGLDTPRSELDRLHAEGVRGIRLQFMPHLGAAPTDEEILRYADLVEPLGWHVEIHVAGTGAVDRFGVITKIPTRVVIDHLGRVDLNDGLDSPPVQALRRLLDTGTVWLKLSGTYRVTLTGAPYDDANALAASLAAHAPERVVWGTDFPHPNLYGPMPDDGILLDGIPDIVPDERNRHKLLVANPTELFDFS
ncbi:amidohydrolase family protein [Rhodococcus opacus]|uniref:Amidohydrolase family protein n=1 Tax=Rhodococcus opacus TaxID=37919 RepID=A0AAX3YQX9_RHOOP|nr:amidohydrolase family protein [Rhodococcus opacus]ELB85982.1 2-pyrone-4,6-dicarboxylic acid hydrolase [Rhodococcus wratislaviensis IFP 2016]NHU48078.1 amidohydrolase family protein [Rhodococcus sp. A14]MBA8962943.1 putative TIM-barrel fold metal-dependent hydrolase [Rhodococcus opacus]MBP2206433.1 putative TIM-barrel fold metal-dependent hydrolase [Rhodococcus opacus]MCZ4588550.1 amidohydrolase family protein [Rhodococcus opacus]